MNVLVIGSGGREHALVWKIAQSESVGKIYCAPGNAGIESLVECVPIHPSDLDGLLHFAHDKKVDLTVVGPEQPLANGIVDLFESNNLKIFGPSKRAAELEWSKAFAKDFMRRNGIPTARHQTFSLGDHDRAVVALDMSTYPLVLKADGLAAGKGVMICEDRPTAQTALHLMMDEKAFGTASEIVVVEEFMTGEEASVFAVCDGTDYVTLAPAQDHKRIFDDDRGANTGGMGAYAPAPVVSQQILEEVKHSIIEPTLGGMAAEGRKYKGCLYVGLMITADGPKVVEFNARFGDPETQVVLPLFDGDIVELILAACEGTIASLQLQNRPHNDGSAVCVVLASSGYPGKYQIGKEIHGLQNLSEGVVAFHGGTTKMKDAVVTAGGRVLGVTAISPNLDFGTTIAAAYEGVSRISFDGMQFRRDIGRRALLRRTQSVA